MGSILLVSIMTRQSWKIFIKKLFALEKQRGYPAAQLVEKPLGARGPQPPEAIIGFGDMRVKSAKSLA